MLNFRFIIYTGTISSFLLLFSIFPTNFILNMSYSENEKSIIHSFNNTSDIDSQLTNLNFEQKLNQILSGGMNTLISDTINKLKPISKTTNITTSSINNFANISSINQSNDVNSSTKVPFISSNNSKNITSSSVDLASKDTGPLLPKSSVDLASKDTGPLLPKSSVDLASKDTGPLLPKSSVDLASKDTGPLLPKSSVDLASKDTGPLLPKSSVDLASKDTGPLLPKSSVDLASKDTNLPVFNFDYLETFTTTKIINDIYSELGKKSDLNILNNTFNYQ